MLKRKIIILAILAALPTLASAQYKVPWEVDTWTYGAPNQVADPVPMPAALRAAQPSTVVSSIPAKLLGSPAQASAACHSVAIDQDTKWVTVTKGEIVRFMAKGREFTWNFDGLATTFDLNAVAPTGTFDRQVFVSVKLRPEQQS